VIGREGGPVEIELKLFFGEEAFAFRHHVRRSALIAGDVQDVHSHSPALFLSSARKWLKSSVLASITNTARNKEIKLRGGFL